MEATHAQTPLAAWKFVSDKMAPASLNEETARLLGETAARFRRWSMVNPTLMAAKALLRLWDQQDAACRLLPCAMQFSAARPGQYAGGHEILLEVLMRADKLNTGATMQEAQSYALRGLLTQALHIGSGSGAAMQHIRTQVCDSVDILFTLGRGADLERSLLDFSHLKVQVLEAAGTLASAALTSMAHYLLCQAAMKDLSAAKRQIDHVMSTLSRPASLPTWVDIHHQLRERLLELGIVCSPQQLIELQLRGSPGHLVQVLFATGCLDPGKFA